MRNLHSLLPAGDGLKEKSGKLKKKDTVCVCIKRAFFRHEDEAQSRLDPAAFWPFNPRNFLDHRYLGRQLRQCNSELELPFVRLARGIERRFRDRCRPWSINGAPPATRSLKNRRSLSPLRALWECSRSILDEGARYVLRVSTTVNNADVPACAC